MGRQGKEQGRQTLATRCPLTPLAVVVAGHAVSSLQRESVTTGKGGHRGDWPMIGDPDHQVRIRAPDLRTLDRCKEKACNAVVSMEARRVISLFRSGSRACPKLCFSVRKGGKTEYAAGFSSNFLPLSLLPLYMRDATASLPHARKEFDGRDRKTGHVKPHMPDF